MIEPFAAEHFGETVVVIRLFFVAGTTQAVIVKSNRDIQVVDIWAIKWPQSKMADIGMGL